MRKIKFRIWGKEEKKVHPKECWLVFDLSNGDELSKKYVWWFYTKKQANAHIEEQKDREFSAELTEPVKYSRK